MKKILILALMLTVKAASAQIKSPCACGGMLVLEVIKFNFHKPRTDCLSGFGICLRLSPIRFECIPCSNFPSGPVAFKEDKVTCYVMASEDKLELHLPASLMMDESFQQDSFEYFEIEEDMLPFVRYDAEKIEYAKAGKYPVERRGEELVVLLQ